MKSQHTPGPWQVLPLYTNRSVYPIGAKIDANASSILAEVNSQGGTSDDCQANARLIASAPELLEALRLLIGQLEGIKPKSGVHSSSLNADMAIARSAIAKATGN